MPLSTEVQVAVIFGVLGVLLAVASEVLAYMAVRETRRKRHDRDGLELQTSYGSERPLSVYQSLDHRHYPLYPLDSGYRDYLLYPDMRFPKPNTGFERLHDVDRPSSFQFDFTSFASKVSPCAMPLQQPCGHRSSDLALHYKDKP